MPNIGYFILHSHYLPSVTAGDYQLRSDHEGLPADKDGTPLNVATQTVHLKVTAPRYVMPTDQILSSFPPANAEGGFANRLPQIVLKRRTLPWERNPVGGLAPSPTPWLALVVVAEGEASLSTAPAAVADCVTPGVKLPHPEDRDVDKGLHLDVTQTVLDKIFPCQDDLALLTHVREVDIHDTELMGGDDDGWLAVVLANRLPVPQGDGTPVRYMACLVNVEGQLDALPKPTPPASGFNFELAQDWRVLSAVSGLGPDAMVQGGGVSLPGVVLPSPAQVAMHAPRAAASGSSADVSRAYLQGGQAAQGGALNGAQGLSQTTKASQWRSATASTTAQVTLAAQGDNAQKTIRQAMTSGFHYPIAQYAFEKVYRFPVLAHWSFTTNEGATFESLMQGLDVDLLGSLPAEASAAAPVAAGAAVPPPAPAPQDTQPEVVATGHISLAQRTRRGDAVRAWYRGPCVPFPTARSGQADTTTSSQPLPLAHSADQLRRVIPDGREDLALASAFEIGRLLALSQLSVVSALLRFRSQQFGAGRLRELLQQALPFELPGLLSNGGALQVNLGRFVAVQMIDALAQNTGRMLGQPRPLADPGRPLAFEGTLDQVIARGLGLDLKAIQEQAGSVGWAQAVQQAAVPTLASQSQDGQMPLDLAHLQAQLQGQFLRTLDVAAPTAVRVKAPAAARKASAARPTAAADPLADPLAELLAHLSAREEPQA
jgi:hypothetical protein